MGHGDVLGLSGGGSHLEQVSAGTPAKGANDVVADEEFSAGT